MIATLPELVAYTRERAARSPEVANRVLLRSPGIDRADGATLLHELPGLPSSYLDCAERFALETGELGMAVLRPSSFGGTGLVDRLVTANGPANPLARFMQAHALYEVARWEADPIAVVREDSDTRPGQVVWLDPASGPGVRVAPLANDFAIFLVMAGRLFQAGHLDARVEAILEDMPLDDEQVRNWRVLASMVLS